MNPNMRNDKLRGVLEDLGMKNVQSVISSGNVLFETDCKDSQVLEELIQAAWPKNLGFTSTTIIRSLGELQALQQKHPYENETHSLKTSLNVTFLQRAQPHAKHLSDGVGYHIAAMYDKEVCSIIDTTRAKTPDFMRQAEKTYGKEITTRTWKTVERIITKLAAS